MNTKISLKVKSSSGEPYDVDFNISDNKYTVFCNCQAGIYGKLCKHKTSLLDGNDTLLLDENDKEKLKQLHEFVKNSTYTEIISSYNILKQEIEKAQKKEKKLREQIEHILKTGVEVFK